MDLSLGNKVGHERPSASGNPDVSKVPDENGRNHAVEGPPNVHECADHHLASQKAGFDKACKTDNAVDAGAATVETHLKIWQKTIRFNIPQQAAVYDPLHEFQKAGKKRNRTYPAPLGLGIKIISDCLQASGNSPAIKSLL